MGVEVNGIAHIQLTVNDAARCIPFWEKLCHFLEIPYRGDMLDSSRYVNYSTGTVWRGNSSFEKQLPGIVAGQTERWRTLQPRIVRMLDFVCGPEMRLAGYEPVTDMADRSAESEVLAYMIENGRAPCSWRTDLGDPQLDYGFELFRRVLFSLDARLLDRDVVRRCFLFEEPLKRLRHEKLV